MLSPTDVTVSTVLVSQKSSFRNKNKEGSVPAMDYAAKLVLCWVHEEDRSSFSHHVK